VYLEETFEFQLLLLDIFEFQDSRLSNSVTALLSEPTEVEETERNKKRAQSEEREGEISPHRFVIPLAERGPH
jgi:hypothetical protein